MSVASSEPRRGASALAHHVSKTPGLILFVLAMAAAHFVLSIALAALVVACNVAVSYAESQHRQMLCERCAVNAPLNPGEAATKHDRELRADHWLADAGLPVVMLLALGAMFIGVVSWWCPPTIGWILFAVGAPIWVYCSYASTKHNELEPWCPYCDDDDDDDDDDNDLVPEPDPVGHATR